MQRKIENFIVDSSIGIMNVHDMRAVIRQKPEPKKAKEVKSATPDLTVEEIEWMSLQKQMWQDQGGFEQ
jgi:hypothetical protein